MNTIVLKAPISGLFFLFVFSFLPLRLSAMEMDEGIQIGSIFMAQDSPISVAFVGGGLPDSLNKEDARNDLEKIVQTWNGVTCSTIRLEIARGNSKPDIGIFWGDNETNRCIRSEKDIGFTNFSPCVNGDITYGPNSILLNANARFDWRHQPDPYQDPQTDHVVDLRAVLTHEIGHALGLQHSDVALATMGSKYLIDGGMSSLAADDKVKLCNIYPQEEAECEKNADCGNGKCVSLDRFRVCEEERNGIGEYCALDDLRCEICLQTSTPTFTGYCTQKCSSQSPCPEDFRCSDKGFCQFETPSIVEEGCSMASASPTFAFLFFLGLLLARPRRSRR